MMNYDVLAAKVAEPPFDTMPDPEVAVALKTPREVLVDVQTREVMGVFLSAPGGDWGKIEGVADGWIPVQDMQIRIAAVTARRTLTLTETMQASDPEKWQSMQNAVALLLGAGIVAQGTAEKVLALPVRKISWADETGWGETLGEPEVKAARVHNGK